jgi:hypothetical protein
MSRVATIHRLFGSGCAKDDADFEAKHGRGEGGKFGSGGGGSQEKPSPLPILSHRASKLEATNNKLKDGIKRLNALNRLGDKVDGEYMDIAEKEGINWNSGWQKEYEKTHPKIPLDVKYYEEYQKFMEEFDPITGGSTDVDELKYSIKVNKKKISKIKKKIAEVEPRKTKNKAHKYK